MSMSKVIRMQPSPGLHLIQITENSLCQTLGADGFTLHFVKCLQRVSIGRMARSSGCGLFRQLFPLQQENHAFAAFRVHPGEAELRISGFYESAVSTYFYGKEALRL